MNNLPGNKNCSFQPYSYSWELSDRLGSLNSHPTFSECWYVFRQNAFFIHQLLHMYILLMSVILLKPQLNMSLLCSKPSSGFQSLLIFETVNLNACLSPDLYPDWFSLIHLVPATLALTDQASSPTFFSPGICVVRFLPSLSLYLNVTFSMR